MKKVLIGALSVITLSACNSGGSLKSESSGKLDYPASMAENTSNTYFGTTVADPYQWMESTNSLQTLEWVSQQNTFSNSYIQDLPEYNSVKAALTPVSNAIKFFVSKNNIQRKIIKIGKEYYYTNMNTSEVNNIRLVPGRDTYQVSVDNKIYVTDSLGGQGKVFLDIQKSGVIKGVEETVQTDITADNKYTIIRTKDKNLDLGAINVVDNATKQALANDEIKNVYGAFTTYSDGFFYVKPQNVTDIYTSNYNQQKLYYHVIGASQSTDQLIFDGGSMLGIDLNEVLYNNVLYFQTAIDQTSQIYSLNPANMNIAPTLFVGDNYQSEFSIFGTTSTNNLLVQTGQGAAQRRLVEVNPAAPESSNWINILPTNSTDIVNSITSCGNYYYAEVLVSGASTLYRYANNSSTPVAIPLPGIGAATDFKCVESTAMLRYYYSNLVTPYQMYEYNPSDQSSTLISTATVSGFDPADYEMKEVFVPTTDGAQVSIFMAYRKGLKLDGNNPTYIYVYGGFDVSLLPQFYSNSALLLENGGIYVIAQVRGGGEYGTAWYNAGRLFNKQNTYNDVTAVANYLINNGYTNPSKLALSGASNGGVTAAAVALQQPDLFKVVYPAVGVLDLLRYQLFTVGFSWYYDYGYSSIQEQFNNLMTFSPLQNVKNISYPTMLVQTGMEDGRVPPLHSYKFAATMQNVAGGVNPYLLKSYANQGHSATNALEAQIDTWTLFFNQTNSPIK